jgi:hypothetical protein
MQIHVQELECINLFYPEIKYDKNTNEVNSMPEVQIHVQGLEVHQSFFVQKV